ncbi:conserved hypothetical protein [Methylocella tundrae]|uniref:Uncharacterized protein n=1 Tax=Methylocella tundrae TaxID=227605 RepID=A0A8B6M537_METTU|nr:hypothetical protein [Methylocella tundrae]VTZ49473.1 conserved hypothetical protein [Methylocella tundrae]
MDSQARYVIDKCGGPKAVATMLGIKLASVYKWTYPKERGGTNGLIPSTHQGELLNRARAAGIELTPDDFFQFAEIVAPAEAPPFSTAGGVS